MKKILSMITALSIFLSGALVLASDDDLGLEPAGKTETPVKGAVEETPPEYIFNYDEKSFIILDKYQKAEKIYFFILTENTYGMKKFDLNKNSGDSLGYWNVNDEFNIANWLNNDFFENGNGTYALPEKIKKYIDKEHVWHTEPIKTLAGYTEEYEQAAPLAFISNYEWQRYIEKIGQNAAKNWWFRTAKSDKGETNQVLVTGSSYDCGMNASWRVNGSPCYIRPAFFLDAEFFENEKISNIGEAAANMVAPYLNEELYTQEELERIYPKPLAVINNITGSKMVGEKINVNYTYLSNFNESGTEIKWYISDSAEGSFDLLIGEGKEIELTGEMNGKYLKASVKPKSEAPVNSYGSIVYSKPFGPVFEKKDIEQAISELKTDKEPFSVLIKYSYIFGIESIDVLNSVSKAEKIFSSISYNNISEVADAYSTAIAIQRLNEAQTEAEIEDILSDIYFDIDGYEEKFKSEQVIDTIIENDFDSYNEFIKKLEEAIIAALFSDEDETSLSKLLGMYSNLLGVSKLEISEIKRLAKKLENINFKNFEALKDQINVLSNELINDRVDLSSEPLFGLIAPGRTATAISTAVEKTPDSIIFNIDNKGFAILDKTVKNGKVYYFVICEDSYGQVQFDMTLGAAAGSAKAIWDIGDENNIAYWLNSEFLENGNKGYKLPEAIKEYIDYRHIWHTEPLRALDGYATEILSVSGLALPACYEWKKYIHLIGQNTIDGMYWMRSARTGDVSAYNTVLVTGKTVPLGTNVGAAANSGSSHLRPVFYLSEDFFKNAKVQTAGTDVALKVDGIINTELYTKAELDKVILPPIVSEIKITGDAVMGEELGVSYNYEGIFEEGESVVKWYAADSGSDEFTQFATGRNVRISDELSGKVIKAGVTPVSKSKANSLGYEIMSNNSLSVYTKEKIAEMISELNNADAVKLEDVFKKYFDILNISTDLKEFSEESQKRIYNSLENILFTDIASVRDAFYGHIALERVNLSNSETIEKQLHQEELKININFYDRIKDKSNINQVLAAADYDNLNDFRKEIFVLVALEEFNAADRRNIKTLLNDYAEIFTKDVTKYTDYELGQIGVFMLDGNYKSLIDIDGAFSNGVNKIFSGNSGSAGGGSGGRGSSGGNNGISASIQDNVWEDVKSKNEKTDIFSDLSDALWAKEMILDLAEKNIISGYDDGTFKPNKTITREEFAAIIVRTFGLKAEKTDMLFSDVKAGEWYYENIMIAFANGIIKGISDNEFGVGRNVKREEMMTIIYRVLNNPISDNKIVFTDSDEISDYAKDAVSYMAFAGYVSGVGNNMFEPHAPATRAMAARIIASVLDREVKV